METPTSSANPANDKLTIRNMIIPPRQAKLVKEHPVRLCKKCFLGVRFCHNNHALAIKRRRGRGGGGTAMPFALSVKAAWDLGIRDRSSQKTPLEQKHVWSIRVRLAISRSWRDFVFFNLAIDSKLRACDLVTLRLDDICSGGNVRYRAKVVQR